MYIHRYVNSMCVSQRAVLSKKKAALIILTFRVTFVTKLQQINNANVYRVTRTQERRELTFANKTRKKMHIHIGDATISLLKLQY